MPLTISPQLSKKLRFWSFASMLLLVYVHGYNLEERYLQPWSTVNEQLSITTFAEYFLANGLFRFRMPMLFIISGYLFAMKDAGSLKAQMRKRVSSLLLPYLIWCTWGLCITWVLETIPYTRELIVRSHFFDDHGKATLLHNYGWQDILYRWLIFPVSYQMWFIRVLFFYNLAYPLFRWVILHPVARWIFFGIAIYLWYTTFKSFFLEGEGFLFFAVGIWLAKKGVDIERKRITKPAAWGIAFVGVSMLKTWLAFKGSSLVGNNIYDLLIFLHKVCVLTGLVYCWYGLDGLVNWLMEKDWFVRRCYYSFMIYAFHAPLVAYFIDVIPTLLAFLPMARLIGFFLLPACLIAASIGVGSLLWKRAPGLYALSTGGRVPNKNVKLKLSVQG